MLYLKNKQVSIMANIQFRLNNGKTITDKSKPQRIYLRYRLGRLIDFCASIGFEVLIPDWDTEKQRVKNKTSILNRYEINNLISNLTTHFETFENKNRENGFTPNYSEVKKHYESYFSVNQESTPVDLFSFIDSFIENAKTKPNPVTKKLVAYNTIKDYTNH